MLGRVTTTVHLTRDNGRGGRQVAVAVGVDCFAEGEDGCGWERE